MNYYFWSQVIFGYGQKTIDKSQRALSKPNSVTFPQFSGRNQTNSFDNNFTREIISLQPEALFTDKFSGLGCLFLRSHFLLISQVVV